MTAIWSSEAALTINKQARYRPPEGAAAVRLLSTSAFVISDFRASKVVTLS
jgi:hypothetical protein